MKHGDRRVIVALDFPDQSSAIALAERLNPALCRVKVGKELFTSAGPSVIDALHKLGHEVFLDLKFHDIPNTTAAAVLASAKLGVWMVNVHASGGREMLCECVSRLGERKSRGQSTPLLIGVTILTSMDQQQMNEVGVAGDVPSQVFRLARLVKDCGLDGVVCSARESADLRAEFGEGFRLVTPGIRPTFAATNDQKRVVTPRQALMDGSDFLVIGRPVTAAADPLKALARIHDEIASVG